MSSEETNFNSVQGEEQPKRTPKWKDPEYVKKYYRERQRKLRGDFKLHPYVMEDGRKWSDHHPWGKFKTYEEWRAWKTSIAKPQVPRPKRMCELCNKEIYEARWANHEKSRPHMKMVDLLLRMGYAKVVKEEDTNPVHGILTGEQGIPVHGNPAEAQATLVRESLTDEAC